MTEDTTLAIPRKMLTLDEVLEIVPMARSTLFEMEDDGRFPRSHLAANRKVWFADEIADWQGTLPSSNVGRLRRRPRNPRKKQPD